MDRVVLVWNMIKDLQAQGFVTAAIRIPVVCPSRRHIVGKGLHSEWME